MAIVTIPLVFSVKVIIFGFDYQYRKVMIIYVKNTDPFLPLHNIPSGSRPPHYRGFMITLNQTHHTR